MKPWVVRRKDGKYLRLDGPFAYPAWVSFVFEASFLTPGRAAQWAGCLDAEALLPPKLLPDKPSPIFHVPGILEEPVPSTRRDGADARAASLGGIENLGFGD